VFTSPPYNQNKEYEQGMTKEDHWELLINSSKLIYEVLKPTGCYLLNINDYVEKDGSRSLHLFDLVLYLSRIIGFKYIENYIWFKGKGLPIKSNRRAWDVYENIFFFSKTMDFNFYYDNIRIPYSEVSLKRYEYDMINRWVREDGKEYSDKKEITPDPRGALPSNVLFIGSESDNQEHTAVFPIKLAKWAINATTKPGDIVLDTFMGSGSVAVACIETGRKYIGYELEERYYKRALNRIGNAQPSLF
jgi:DNA modification methylase